MRQFLVELGFLRLGMIAFALMCLILIIKYQIEIRHLRPLKGKALCKLRKRDMITIELDNGDLYLARITENDVENQWLSIDIFMGRYIDDPKLNVIADKIFYSDKMLDYHKSLNQGA